MSNFSIEDLKPEISLCSLEIEGAIAHLTLRREDVYNALNIELISEIISILDWTRDRSVGERGTLKDEGGSPYLRIIVLRGAGKHFCAGADINMMRDAGAKSPEENRADSERLDRLFHSLWSHPCFTIGKVQGVALGGGAGLIACLDHVIGVANLNPVPASPDKEAQRGFDIQIALSEGKLGILPAVIGPYVYRKIGSAEFRRLSMLAGRIGAREAKHVGLINSYHLDKYIENSPKKGMAPATFGEIQRIIDEVLTTGPMAVAEAKKLTLTFDRWNGTDEELRLWTLDKTSEMRGSEEGQEGLASFLEKRPPNWKEE